MERQHLWLLTTESKTANVLEFGLLASGEIQHRDLVVSGTTLLPEPARLALRWIHGERKKARIAGDRDDGSSGPAEEVRRPGGQLADRETPLGRAVRRLPDDDRRVAFVRREHIGEPLPVSGEHRCADRAPGAKIGWSHLLRARDGSRVLRLLRRGRVHEE